jgi:hypothetical protein
MHTLVAFERTVDLVEERGAPMRWQRPHAIFRKAVGGKPLKPTNSRNPSFHSGSSKASGGTSGVNSKLANTFASAVTVLSGPVACKACNLSIGLGGYEFNFRLLRFDLCFL